MKDINIRMVSVVVSVGGAHVYIKKQLCNVKISNLSESKGYRLLMGY